MFSRQVIIQRWSIVWRIVINMIWLLVYYESRSLRWVSQICGTLRCVVAIKESYPVFTQGQVHSRRGSTEWRPEDGEAKQTGVRQVLSVGETVHLIMLQLLVGLTKTCHHQASLSSFREILPLLQPPKDQCLSEEVSNDFILIMPCC